MAPIDSDGLGFVTDVFDAAYAEEFEDLDLRDAFARFAEGDYVGAEEAAAKAENTARNAAAAEVERAERIAEGEWDVSADQEMGSQPSGGRSMGFFQFTEDVEERADEEWKQALDSLAIAYEDSGFANQAEALYLRMLAWREGAEHYRMKHFEVANQLFQKGPEYSTVDDATWFLKNLRADDGYAIPEVVKLLALGEQVASKACFALWTLSLRPKQRPHISECGGLELLTKALTQYPVNGELQAYGCGTIRLLCQGHALAAKNRELMIGELFGIEVLIGAIRNNPKDSEVLREALGALLAASTQNPRAVRRIIESDGVQLSLDAILACPSDEAVGDCACRLLTVLQEAPKEGTDEDYLAKRETKLLSERDKAVVRCDTELRTHLAGSQRSVLQSLLVAVRTLTEDERVRPQAIRVVEPVVACMQRFPGVPRIQSAACGIFWLLTSGNHTSREDAISQIAFNGGIAALCQALRDLPLQEDLQRLAIGCLRNCTFNSDAFKTLAVRAGGIAATVVALKRCPNDAVLADYAIGALTCLCDSVGRAKNCAREGGIEAVVAALRKHAANGNIAQLACVLLCMFCDDDHLRRRIVQAGARSTALALSRMEPSEAQQWGAQLLKDLAEQ